MCCHIAGGGQEQKDAGVKPFCALLFTVQESWKQLQGYVCVLRHANWDYCYCARYQTSQTAPLAAHWMANRFKHASITFNTLQTSPTLYSITSPLCPHTHVPVTYFQFCGTTFCLVLGLFLSLHQKYGILYLFTLCSLKYSSFRLYLKTNYF